MSRRGRWSCRGKSESKGEVVGTRNHSQRKPLLKLKETAAACSQVRHNGVQSGTHQKPASTVFLKGRCLKQELLSRNTARSHSQYQEPRVAKEKTVSDQPLPIGTIISGASK